MVTRSLRPPTKTTQNILSVSIQFQVFINLAQWEGNMLYATKANFTS